MTKGELTRRHILDAAIARFGRDGYRATSVADIARGRPVGGTVPYAYFAGKEALFFAAVDEDAAAVIQGLSDLFARPGPPDWQATLLGTLVDAVDRHPLARRLLAGLEPEVTARVLEIPALAELRKVCADRLAGEQQAGTVRPDIEPGAHGQRRRHHRDGAAPLGRAAGRRRHQRLPRRGGRRLRRRPGTADPTPVVTPATARRRRPPLVSPPW